MSEAVEPQSPPLTLSTGAARDRRDDEQIAGAGTCVPPRGMT
jgi:hypothetical protein